MLKWVEASVHNVNRLGIAVIVSKSNVPPQKKPSIYQTLNSATQQPARYRLFGLQMRDDLGLLRFAGRIYIFRCTIKNFEKYFTMSRLVQ